MAIDPSDAQSVNEDFTNHITIEKMMIRGLSRMSKDAFGLHHEPIFISTTDKWNVLNNLRKQKDARVEFPFMTFKLQTFEINPQSYNPKALLRRGVFGAPNDANNSVYKTEPIPVNITLEMAYVTDNLYGVLNFANAWVYASARKLINMDIEFDGVSYSVQCELDSSLSIPEKDMQVDQVNAYEFASSIIIHGYVSPAKALQDFPRIPMLSKVNVGFNVASSNTTGSNANLNTGFIEEDDTLSFEYSEDGVLIVRQST